MEFERGLRDLVEWAEELGAEALHVQEGEVALALCEGKLSTRGAPRLPAGLVGHLLPLSGQRVTVEGAGEFLVQAWHLPRGVGIRLQPFRVAPTAEELGIPQEPLEILLRQPGLTLVCGPAEGRPDRAWAALIDRLNHEFHQHILTLEQPMAWFHYHKRSMVAQREFGQDFHHWHQALQSAYLCNYQVLAVRAPWQRRALGSLLENCYSGAWTLLLCRGASVTEAVGRLVDLFPRRRQSFYRRWIAGRLSSIFCFSPDRLEVLEGRIGIRQAVRDGYPALEPDESWSLQA